jgi:hypothetical protein
METETNDKTPNSGGQVDAVVMPLPVISSYDLDSVAAFSVARVWDGELQHLNDIWPNSACEFYQAKEYGQAAVFGPFDDVEVDGDVVSWATFFESWDDRDMQTVFFVRDASEINMRA